MDFQMRSYDKQAAYTNLITLAGYAGAFAIWHYASPALSKRENGNNSRPSCVISCDFHPFRGRKDGPKCHGACRTRRTIGLSKLTPEELHAEVKRANDKHNEDPFLNLYWFWVATLIVAVGGIIGALLVLFYGCGATLFGWPHWT